MTTTAPYGSWASPISVQALTTAAIGLSAVQLDADVLPIGPDNPYGLAMTNRATVITSEAESARDASWATQRRTG